jgi:hypothetical protein
MSLSKTLRQIGFYAGMILIVLVLYVLSVGPALWLTDNSPSVVQRTVYAIYTPLWMLQDTEVDNGLLYWYLSQWLLYP